MTEYKPFNSSSFLYLQFQREGFHYFLHRCICHSSEGMFRFCTPLRPTGRQPVALAISSCHVGGGAEQTLNRPLSVHCMTTTTVCLSVIMTTGLYLAVLSKGQPSGQFSARTMYLSKCNIVMISVYWGTRLATSIHNYVRCNKET